MSFQSQFGNATNLASLIAEVLVIARAYLRDNLGHFQGIVLRNNSPSLLKHQTRNQRSWATRFSFLKVFIQRIRLLCAHAKKYNSETLSPKDSQEPESDNSMIQADCSP